VELERKLKCEVIIPFIKKLKQVENPQVFKVHVQLEELESNFINPWWEDYSDSDSDITSSEDEKVFQ